MLERLAQWAEPVLESTYVRRTRRNHGLEHATVHLLSARTNNPRIAGRSSDGGFVIIGNVKTEDLERAAHDALARMRRGEHQLAVHPNCGTNLVTAGAMTTLAGVVGLGGSSRRVDFDRIPWTMILMIAAVLGSQPLGMKLQRLFTTKGDPGDLEIVSITRRPSRWPFKNLSVHFVSTRRG